MYVLAVWHAFSGWQGELDDWQAALVLQLQYLYNTAKYFNHRINKAQAQKLTIQPTLGPQPSSTEMIDPLACPFLPMPTQDLRNLLTLLQSQAGCGAVQPNTLPQVDEELPST